MKMLGEAGVIFQVVFTKHDKVKELQFKEVLEASFEKMAAHANAFSEVLLTSSRKGHGIAILRATISKLFHLN